MFTGSSVPADAVNKFSAQLASETDPTERAWQLLLLAWMLNDPKNRTAALNYLQEAHRLACKHKLPHARKYAEDLLAFYFKQKYPELSASLVHAPGVLVELLELMWRTIAGTKHDANDANGSWADKLGLP